MILSKAEIAALGQGKRSTVDVPAHKQRRLYRSSQGIKDNTIELFACRFTAQMDRLGCNGHDARHVNNLIRVLDTYVQRAQRLDAKPKKRRNAA